MSVYTTVLTVLNISWGGVRWERKKPHMRYAGADAGRIGQKTSLSSAAFFSLPEDKQIICGQRPAAAAGLGYAPPSQPHKKCFVEILPIIFDLFIRKMKTTPLTYG